MYEINKGKIIDEPVEQTKYTDFKLNVLGTGASPTTSLWIFSPTLMRQTTATVVSTAARLNAFADVYVNISKARSERARTLCMCVCTLTDFDQAERTDGRGRDGSDPPPCFSLRRSNFQYSNNPHAI